MEQIMALISKASVILAFVFISTLIGKNFKVNKNDENSKRDYTQVIQGLVFTLFIFIDIKTPFVGANKISYDAREVLLNLAAAGYGPITAAITATATFIIRWLRGTKGTEIALCGIALVYFLEIGFIYVLRVRKLSFNSVRLFLMALLTNIISAMTVLMMAGEGWVNEIEPALTFVITYPIFTVVAFNIMQYIRNREQLLSELSERDKTLHQKNCQLQYANEELQRNEQHFRTMFYYSSEAIFLLEKDQISDVNLAAMKLLEYDEKAELQGKSLFSLMPERQKEDQTAEAYIEDVFRRLGSGTAVQTEVMLRTRNNMELLLESVFIELELTDKKYIYMSARDIRDRKRQEREILFRAQHDALTEVANRQYFNEMLKKIEMNEGNYPLAFMMVDINGLKLTNDIFGHFRGDELIVKVAGILSGSCRSRDLVARVGGDEFVILFPKADEAVLKRVTERIRQKLEREKIETLPLSVAIGYAVKADVEGATADEVMAAADESMYQDKQMNRQANARRFLQGVLEKLYQISPQDKTQTEELEMLLARTEGVPELNPSIRKEIAQLSTYLNVGKLILDRDEWEMSGYDLQSLRFPQKLVESSYAVLRNVGEIETLVIAEYLTGVNEAWDGSEGVLDISGEEIPLAVRAFRILFDAYYIKTHPQRFGKDLSQIKADMLALAGRRYDPELCEKMVECIIDSTCS